MTFDDFENNAGRYTIFVNFVLKANVDTILAEERKTFMQDHYGPDSESAVQANKTYRQQHFKSIALNGCYFPFIVPWVIDALITIGTLIYDSFAPTREPVELLPTHH